MGGGLAEDAGHVAEKVVDHVAPVAVHIDNHAAAVLGAVVPGGALDGLAFVLAGKDPIAELTAHGEDFSEKALFFEELEFADAGEPELVLYGAVFHAGLLRNLGDAEGFRVFCGGGFLAINVLTSGDGALKERDTVGCAGGVEENLIVGIGEGRIEVGGETLYTVFFCEVGELVRVAAC